MVGRKTLPCRRRLVRQPVDRIAAFIPGFSADRIQIELEPCPQQRLRDQIAKAAQRPSARHRGAEGARANIERDLQVSREALSAGGSWLRTCGPAEEEARSKARRQLFARLQPRYPAALAFIGRDDAAARGRPRAALLRASPGTTRRGRRRRHPPDLDLPYHAENGSKLVF
jgi:hypothetical protein